MAFQDLDALILSFFVGINNPHLTIVFTLIHHSIYLYVIYSTYYLYKKHSRERFFHYLFNLTVGFLFIEFLKRTINRPRPEAMLIKKVGSSFPSRHSFTSMLNFRFLHRDFLSLGRVLLMVYSLSIPLSTLFLGVHYPSDVLVGSLMGLVFPFIINERVCSRVYTFLLDVFTKVFKGNVKQQGYNCKRNEGVVKFII